jgi:hypothetical protein
MNKLNLLAILPIALSACAGYLIGESLYSTIVGLTVGLVNVFAIVAAVAFGADDD